MGYPEKFSAGSHLVLGKCDSHAANQFFVVDGSTMRLGDESGTVLCVTLAGYDTEHGKPMLLDICRPGYFRQRLAAMCLHGEGGINHTGTWAFGKYCDSQKHVKVPLIGVSLFCFMAVLPNSAEVALKDAAASRGASIFACEASKVYWSWRTGTYHTPGDGDFTANIDVFQQIWQQVWDDQIYKSHDWTVKVDPDAVWVPQRLRSRLWAFSTNIQEPVYVRNTWKSFGFLGPLEVLSQTAVARLSEMNLKEACPYTSDAGEDGWLKDCMEDVALIGWKEDVHLLYSDCQVDACSDHSFVAYHYYKHPDSWNDCMDRAR